MNPKQKLPSKKLEPLVVTPLDGELVRFHVGSRSRAGAFYLVDLEENNWLGKCSCINFEMVGQPKYNRGYPPSDSLRCSHIKRARCYVLDEVLPKLVKALRHDA